MQISYEEQDGLLEKLRNYRANSQHFILLVTGAFKEDESKQFIPYLQEAIRILKNGGILFVQGIPNNLPELGVFLEKSLVFKYWIAVESEVVSTGKLPTVHAPVLLFTKGDGRFNIKRTRLPHQYCAACQRTLKDWGGKSHLMHPDGYVISDVIKDLPSANNYTQISKPLFDLLIRMLDFHPPDKKSSKKLVNPPAPEIKGVVAPVEGLPWRRYLPSDRLSVLPETAAQYKLPPPFSPAQNDGAASVSLGKELFNVIHQGDSIEILKQYPDASIDLVFADPPYNLDKNYNVYSDEQADSQYVAWCNAWLAEYVRILKPTGSLFILNLPRWAIYHADFLNRHLHFQNWIVWDAMSEPRGKLMPAHYALLFYTKHPVNFTFNYEAMRQIDARRYCLRTSCVKKRKRLGDDKKVDLTDIWWDIHRIKHRRDRDHHPCQLPEALLERIIKLATNPDDVVLDAFGGVGTTPIVALQLGRRYVAIDIDPYYVKIMRDKIAQIQEEGYIERESVKKSSRVATKKALQLELRQLTIKLGRLPTPEDVEENSQYDLQLFLDTFPSWGKALKAAKLELQQ